MFYQLMTVELGLVLFLAMWACHELGRAFGRRALKRQAAEENGTGLVEAAVLALLGLLLAFAFGSAASRLEQRRQQIVQEANAIGTAWLRLDLLPESDQPPLRDLFRRYLDARIAVYQNLPDLPSAYSELDRANQLQSQIWTAAQQSTRRAPGPQVSMLVLPALNDMIDITTTRTITTKAHIPVLVMGLLFATAMLSAVLAGNGGAARPRRNLQTLVFTAVISITVYVILDLEFPRVGLIRVSSADEAMLDLRKSMN